MNSKSTLEYLGGCKLSIQSKRVHSLKRCGQSLANIDGVPPPLLLKVCGHYEVTFLYWMSILEWYMVRLVVDISHLKNIWYNDIETRM